MFVDVQVWNIDDTDLESISPQMFNDTAEWLRSPGREPNVGRVSSEVAEDILLIPKPEIDTGETEVPQL